MTKLSVTIHDAKTNLSKYLRRVQQGATVTLCKKGEPVAQIIPFKDAKKKGLPWGPGKGLIEIKNSFFDELTDKEFPGIGLPKKTSPRRKQS